MMKMMINTIGIAILGALLVVGAISFCFVTHLVFLLILQLVAMMGWINFIFYFGVAFIVVYGVGLTAIKLVRR